MNHPEPYDHDIRVHTPGPISLDPAHLGQEVIIQGRLHEIIGLDKAYDEIQITLKRKNPPIPPVGRAKPTTELR